jgi:preprotein translocase subunit SecA
VSRFYLSLGDDLMRRFNGQAVEAIMNRLNVPDDVPIEAGMVTKAIRSAQTQVEQQNFEIRKNVLKYDEVLNKQRMVIYDERRRVLAGENLQEQVEHMLSDVIQAYIDGATANTYSEEWDLDALWTALGTLYPIAIRWQDLIDGDEEFDEDGEPIELSVELLHSAVLADAREAYKRREAEIDALIPEQGGMRELERQILLTVLDRKWREHLYEMDYLKEGIGLRAMAQRDPLIEYQREGFDMFAAMMDGIKEEAVGYLFNVEVAPPDDPAHQRAAQAIDSEEMPNAADPAVTPSEVDEEAIAHGRHAAAGDAPVALGGARVSAPEGRLEYSGPDEDGTATRRATNGRGDGNGGAGEPSRNQPCPCGSGRKYKHCHGTRTALRG